MKKTKPQPPENMPEGTAQIGGPIGWFRISLDIASIDLDPNFISSVFGIEPDYSQKKGVPLLHPDGTTKKIPKFGKWGLTITPDDTDEWNIEEAAWLLIKRVPTQIDLWAEIPKEASRILSFGVSLNTWNQEFSLLPEITNYVAERNIRLDFDIYADSFQEKVEEGS